MFSSLSTGRTHPPQVHFQTTTDAAGEALLHKKQPTVHVVITRGHKSFIVTARRSAAAVSLSAADGAPAAPRPQHHTSPKQEDG